MRGSRSKDAGRVERAVAQKLLAIARKQRHAVEAKLIERMGDLCAGAVHASHRHGGEGPEARGPARDELGRVFVAAARERLAVRRRAEADAGLRQRGERNLDAVRIHQIERELWRPFRIAADGGAASGGIDRLAVKRRNVMKVNVDAARRSHRCCPSRSRSTYAVDDSEGNRATVEFHQSPCLYAIPMPLG